RPHPGVPGESGLGHQGASAMSRLRKREAICRVDGRQGRYGTQEIRLLLGRDLTFYLQGELGPNGLPDRAADLLEFAALVYRLERLFRRQRTNPPRRIRLSFPVRCLEAWGPGALEAAFALLRNLGSAEWELTPRGASATAPVLAVERSERVVD